jgi:tetratricopeptide (TPR) repeat protein
MNAILSIAVFCVITATTVMPEFACAAADCGRIRSVEAKPLNRKDPADHYYRAVTYESAGQIGEAMREYRQVLRLSPAHGDARRRLAEIHLLRGNPANAIEQYRELVRYQEQNPVIRYRLAQLYESGGNYRKATDEYREAAKLVPGALPARRGLALLYAKRKMPNEAAAEYRGILNKFPDDISARNALIALYLRGKKYDELTDFLRETVERKPNDPTGHYKLGLAHEFSKNYDGAVEEYGKAIELDSSYAKPMNALARVYLKTNRIDEAKKLLEAAGKADPDLKESALLLQNFNEEFKPSYGVKKNKKRYSKQIKKSGKTKISKKKKASKKAKVSGKTKTGRSKKKARR